MKENLFFNNLRILSDENIPFKLIELLKEEGCEVKESPLGFSDRQLSSLAKEESRIILTLDKDFFDKSKFPPENFDGIIFIDIQPPLIDEVFSSLNRLFKELSQEKYKGKLIVVSKFGYRFK